MNNPRPTITVIPATIDRENPLTSSQKKRVAAYARVSTDSEEQLNSYEAQVSFYTNHIKSKAEWVFVKVYSDEGISAISTKNRDGFNEMIKDALSGEIDLIITKSVSRFARNTVDTLTAVRHLKEKGVEVYFEKENIYTLDSKGELLITIMSSLAQEESRSISENVTWGQRKRMQDGKVSLPYKRFLGYAKGADGAPEIVEAEAATVRQIYSHFMAGGSYREIADSLTSQGVLTPGGKAVWSVSTVQSILRNEKYAGNAILQKAYTVDFLTKKRKKNEGEVPQYFVENSHPAIIAPETFELVQAEMRRRKAIGKQLSGSGAFVCKIVCGDCGGFYGSKVWHSTDKHRRIIWRCNRKYDSGTICRTPHLTEDELKSAFVQAFNRLLLDRERYIAEYGAQISELAEVSGLDEEIVCLQIECAEAVAQAEALIAVNARSTQDQARYMTEHDALVARYDSAKDKLEAIAREKQERAVQREKIRQFIGILEHNSVPIDAFDESLWNAAIETVTVRRLGEVAVKFKSGTEIVVSAKAL